LGAEFANFPQRRICIGALKFNFAPKFSKNMGFLAQNVVFLEENFPTG